MDTGIHYIGSLDEGQIMNQYFRYFGIMDKLSIKRMDEEVFDRIYYKDAIYDYAMGHERFHGNPVPLIPPMNGRT